MSKEYEVKCRSPEASKHLLVESIVQSQEVENVYLFEEEERMINEVAAECRGVPLLLFVFGKHLSVERNKDNYQKALEVLREGNLDNCWDEGLEKTLMYVYDKIKEVEVQEAFLDISTYFHGWKWNLVIDIVDSRQLKDLHSRALVTRSSSGEVIVHDILRFMGMKKGRLNRFTNYKDFSHAFENSLVGFENVKGISLLNDNCLITIKSTQLEAMHQSLRVLMLGDWVTLDGPPCHGAFGNLRCLIVGDITAFPFKDPPKLHKLRVFQNRSKPGMDLCHLPSSLKYISHDVVECDKFVELPIQNLTSLKRFSVKAQKTVKLPEELHFPTSLVHLNLNGCKNLPKDISFLTALESFILDGSDLECLPQGIGQLKKLKYLSMNYCSELAFLSEDLTILSSLEVLRMNGCENLKALPERLGGLISLQRIQFSKCTKLQDLPESFGELRIQSLDLHLMVNLNKLPNSFGNMTLLKYLRIESCHSLISLPNSFVELKMLETLKIFDCSKLSHLPQNFGRLRCLNDMTVQECHLLKELPNGFGALPALKTLMLQLCDRFVNLSRDFGELTRLEALYLLSLPLMSRFPNGFGRLKNLRDLFVDSCFHLETLSCDFENMATLERLTIRNAVQLNGYMMYKILKLPSCYRADICGSTDLLDTWDQIQCKTEHPIVVVTAWGERDIKYEASVALLHGKFMEMRNGSDRLIERPSLLVGLEEGTTAMVAGIMLPIHMQSHQHPDLERFVEMASKSAENNGKLQIVCARKVDMVADRAALTQEEERAEEQGIRQILQKLPEGWCAIPSSESKRIKILQLCCSAYKCDDELSFFLANVEVDIEGRQNFKFLRFTKEDEVSGNVHHPSISEMRGADNIHYDMIQNFIESITEADEEIQSEGVAGESKTKEFIEALKGNGIHHLLIENKEMVVDDLHGKAIGLFICDLNFFECIKLQQIYKDLQQKDPNFLWIWIPIELPEDCGYATYTSLIECMPWATFPHPQLVNVQSGDTCFVLLDKHGQIANRDALPMLLAWGAKSYPFIQHTIPESLFMVEYESCLEFLLQGIYIVGRQQMTRKMTFLHTEDPKQWLEKKSEVEELTQIHGSFEVLYVGPIFSARYVLNKEIVKIENVKREYADATRNMAWPSLSFSDMIVFWYRCKYLASKEVYELNKQSNVMVEILHEFARQLYNYKPSLLLIDNGGLVTRGGYDVVEMICKLASDEIGDREGMAMKTVKNEVLESLRRGERTPFLKMFLRDEIDIPRHPQHHIEYLRIHGFLWCEVCHAPFTRGLHDGLLKRSYGCFPCEWFMCWSCWIGICHTITSTSSD